MNKRSDADAEAAQTPTWLRFAKQRGYLNADDFSALDQPYDQLCAGLVTMVRNPADPWCGPSTLRAPPMLYDTNGPSSTNGS